MNPAFLALALFAAVPLVHATVWRGTITETISASDDPQYAAGQVFTGYYQYTSASIDGTFDVVHAGSTAANATLTGLLFDGTPAGGMVALQQAPYADNHITVSGGVVTAFVYQDEAGGNQWMGGAGPSTPFTFEFTPLSGPASSYTITGTIAFTDPVDPPANVPDVEPTDLLVGIGLLGLGFRRLRTK